MSVLGDEERNTLSEDGRIASGQPYREGEIIGRNLSLGPFCLGQNRGRVRVCP